MSNTAKALESCVTVSAPLCGSREMRNVPSTHPATVNPPAGERSRNSTASAPELNLGVPSTVAVRCPERPPGRRTVIVPGKFPFRVSRTSNVVSVQIEPFSQRDSPPAQRTRATASDSAASRSRLIRASVVARTAGKNRSAGRREKIIRILFLINAPRWRRSRRPYRFPDL